MTRTRKSTFQKVQTFKARQRRGDVKRIADLTGFSESHVGNVLNFRRSDTLPSIVETAYKISYRRKKNSEMTNA